ncbi:hypothetical protein N781_01520 [Pontibacillus halophilus JSM 076056 = DSM 19796]|uniref:Uncharacterized protein n=1 Tax=Pontibacillus halophilus JSM 076056 = DSM 19796 TaxID=1385510 RepID=A0A0A5IE26_9BACI|nr:AimR family lysis-lysogeny pheromone receptor [Pontibacillus halophilus]KGX94077.1 hypothetical protein N781_01520 [Pontibacillus halophilus JSM 076056 = DSM 19796]
MKMEQELSLHSKSQIWAKVYGKSRTTAYLKEMILQQETDETIQSGLEFLQMNGYEWEFSQLYEEFMNSGEPMKEAWVRLYELQLLLGSRNSPYSAIREELETMEWFSAEQRCYGQFLLARVHYAMQSLHVIDVYNELVRQLDLLPISLLKGFLQLKKDRIQLHYHWKRNELIFARKIAYRSLRESTSTVHNSEVHMTLALTYLYESFEQSTYHLNEASSLVQQYKLRSLQSVLTKRVIPFVMAYNGRTNGITTTDVAERAHLLLAKGENEEALALLETIQDPTPLEHYYIGKAKGDIEILGQAYGRFIHEQSDHFYAKLPLYELNRLSNL